jgi:hypothetical protein
VLLLVVGVRACGVVGCNVTNNNNNNNNNNNSTNNNNTQQQQQRKEHLPPKCLHVCLLVLMLVVGDGVCVVVADVVYLLKVI